MIRQNHKNMLKFTNHFSSTNIMTHTIEAVGVIHSPYAQKFAIPRQPGLVTAARAEIELYAGFDGEAVRGLTDFSHIWVFFLFHENLAQGWQPLVRPPRLGGNTKVGVFASRSTFRPNGIGMSVVELLAIQQHNDKTKLLVRGGDWVNGTPVIDIKPYLPYVDAIPSAQGGYAHTAPEQHLTVVYAPQALQQLRELANAYANLEELITQVLQQDPRPAYKRNKASEQIYGMQLYDLNIQWRVEDQQNLVINITKDF
ncbi:tRNA (N6-threonylcarbamoyladenosine(37)-N6)-methyltransferase TrmO [Pseudidiomarina homiensis]|nr:tRNA (N6-threonylcarbamoyladenosine(37)-N6)-methyltransferase TrmO [Pseudidiomarina homiensis]